MCYKDNTNALSKGIYAGQWSHTYTICSENYFKKNYKKENSVYGWMQELTYVQKS